MTFIHFRDQTYNTLKYLIIDKMFIEFAHFLGNY